MIGNILVVCRGNVCRSPVAAAMLRQRLPSCRVSSAGLGALVGQSVEPEALQLASAAGFDVSHHRARQLDEWLLAAADLVLVMSESQRREVAQRWPQAMGKTMRLGHWLAQGKGEDIPDPYRRSPDVFADVHRLLDSATLAWSLRL